jgi:hypothetical protein
MEADISILRKTGHFYFALTRIRRIRRPSRCQRRSAWFWAANSLAAQIGQMGSSQDHMIA